MLMPNGNSQFSIFNSQFKVGAIAQLVEQRTENPCVPGSIPGGTTKKTQSNHDCVFFIINLTPIFPNNPIATCKQPSPKKTATFTLTICKVHKVTNKNSFR